MVSGFLIECVLLVILCIKEKDKAKKIFLAASLIIGLAIYEAVIILYLPGKMDRMLLVCVVGFAYMICVMAGKKMNIVYLCLQIVCFILLPVSKEESLPLPVKAEKAVDYGFLQDSLEEVLDFSENDRWDNTVALVPPNVDLHAIITDSLKSKYIYVEEDSELNNLCAEKYLSIWKQEGYVIYEKTYNQ